MRDFFYSVIEHLKLKSNLKANKTLYCHNMSHFFQEGGPIGLIKDGDVITIDIEKRRMDVNLTDAELNERRKKWTPPPYKAEKGVLYKVNLKRAKCIMF